MSFTTSLSILAREDDARRFPTRLKAAVLFLGSAVAVPISAMGQNTGENCADLMDKTRSEVKIANIQEEYDDEISNFCSEYKSNSEEMRSRNYSANYKFVGGSVGSQNMNVDQIYQSYCNNREETEKNMSSYEKYRSWIPAAAFRAYEVCVKAERETGIRVGSGAIVTEREIILGVGFTSSDVSATERSVQVNSTKNVNCGWNEHDGNVATIQKDWNATLRCTRKNFEERGEIRIAATRGKFEHNINWPKYVKVPGSANSYEEDMGVDYRPEYVMEDIKRRIKNLENSMIKIKSGEMHFFHRKIGDAVVNVDYEENLSQMSDFSSKSNGPRDQERIITREVIFEGSQFTSPPKVVMGINTLDGGGQPPPGKLRVEVAVNQKDIGINGFSYKLKTWGNSRMYRVGLTWLAYGK